METEHGSCSNVQDASSDQDMSCENIATRSDIESADCEVKTWNGTHQSTSHSQHSEQKLKLLYRLARSDAFFKHQQRDDPDLTTEEKVEIAVEILDQDPIKFLRRFHPHMGLEDVDYFDDLRGEYEVDFYLKEICDMHDKSKSEARVKNRRYMALQKLTKDGEYFSVEEMKWRDPLLYEEMVGRFMSEDDVKEKVEGTDLSFSNVLLQHYDQLQENALYKVLKEREDDQREEGDSDSEEDEMDDLADSAEQPDCRISAAEKLQLLGEFRQTMEMRFLSGQDREFDYSKVDNNAAYDDLDALDEAAQDKYFDED